MSDIQISREEVTANYNTFKEQNGELESAVANFNAAAQELSGSWEGEAKETFDANMTELKPLYEELKTQMNEFCEFLQKTVNTYTENEQVVQGILNKIK